MSKKLKTTPSYIIIGIIFAVLELIKGLYSKKAIQFNNTFKNRSLTNILLTLQKKMFGIFGQYPLEPTLSIFRGFDDVFNMPQSRHTEVHREDIEKVKDLKIIAESPDSGVSMVMARGGREFFITGHLEYAPDTLDKEYRRDLGTRDDVELPVNYYRDNNPDNDPLVTWRAHANLLYSNWINYYVYQETPYNIDDIS